jgi:hypothetical protein
LCQFGGGSPAHHLVDDNILYRLSKENKESINNGPFSRLVMPRDAPNMADQ